MRTLALLILLTLLAPVETQAQPAESDWVAQKCAAYAAAWRQAVDAFNRAEVAPAFVAGNQQFIASGCTEKPAALCPRSKTELDMANALTLALMNAGTASTFLPFNCPQAEPATGGWTGPGL